MCLFSAMKFTTNVSVSVNGVEVFNSSMKKEKVDKPEKMKKSVDKPEKMKKSMDKPENSTVKKTKKRKMEENDMENTQKNLYM